MAPILHDNRSLLIVTRESFNSLAIHAEHPFATCVTSYSTAFGNYTLAMVNQAQQDLSGMSSNILTPNGQI